MGATASLHRHHARLQLRHHLADILSAYAPPHHDLSRTTKARKAAYILAQVDPNNRDLHWFSPFLLLHRQLKAAGWRGGPFHNLGNFMRTLATPKTAEPWSLTSLREKLIKIGAKVVSHGRYVTFQMAKVAVPRQMFQEILSLIARLRPPPAPA